MVSSHIQRVPEENQSFAYIYANNFDYVRPEWVYQLLEILGERSGNYSNLYENRVLQCAFSRSLHLTPEIRNNIADFEMDLAVQVVIPAPFQPRNDFKLAVFDMDSTLILQECIDCLAHYNDLEDQVAAITRLAMDNEIDFNESLRQRVLLLKGLPVSALDKVRNDIELAPGVDEFLSWLHQMGITTAVISGGFKYFAEDVAKQLGIKYVYANDLEIQDGKLTGQLIPGSIVIDAAKKRELFLEIALREGITNMQQTLAVGDGANDLPMLHSAGLGVALNARHKVHRSAPCKLGGQQKSMMDIIYLMGYNPTTYGD